MIYGCINDQIWTYVVNYLLSWVEETHISNRQYVLGRSSMCVCWFIQVCWLYICVPCNPPWRGPKEYMGYMEFSALSLFTFTPMRQDLSLSLEPAAVGIFLYYPLQWGCRYTCSHPSFSCCRSVCLFVFTWMLGIYMQTLLLMWCMFLPAEAEAKAVSLLPAEENRKQYQDRHVGVIIYK